MMDNFPAVSISYSCALSCFLCLQRLSMLYFLAAVCDPFRIQLTHSYPHARAQDSYLSYLPLAHVMERLVQAALTASGARLGFFQGDTLKLMDDIKVMRLLSFACPSTTLSLSKRCQITAFLLANTCPSTILVQSIQGAATHHLRLRAPSIQPYIRARDGRSK